eukprot:TRINITY_DN12660_c0_g1_i1.p1 TRINITY_DN12660_c0_g1~~TRINITY_DN12660_c0_g1_i1.p1  ORF type:complete len:648 (+),score=105.34 TRINITY_DN12660_c0_g1_i1:459-2402(+)
MTTRPEWLGATGPGQMMIPPERWGMTIKQIKRLLRYIMGTPRYRKLQQEHGKVNMYHINDSFLIPWTITLGSSIALLLNPKGLAAQAMASHAWGEECEEFLDALELFQYLNYLSDEFGIWVCTFAQYQAKKSEDVDDVGPSVAEQLALDPFSRVIHSKELVLGLVAIHTHSCDLYSRLWCPFEMSQAIAAQIRVQMAASTKYLDGLEETFEYFLHQMVDQQLDTNEAFELMAAHQLGVDTSSASCSSHEDQCRIRDQVVANGGFEMLDKAIFHLRKKFVKAEIAKRIMLSGDLDPAPPESARSSNDGERIMLSGDLDPAPPESARSSNDGEDSGSERARSPVASCRWRTYGEESTAPDHASCQTDGRDSTAPDRARSSAASCQSRTEDDIIGGVREQLHERVVISFQNHDLAFMRRLRQYLNDRDIPTADSSQVPPGQDWREFLFFKLKKADILIPILGGNYLFSRACESELMYSTDHAKKIVPVLCDPKFFTVLMEPENYVETDLEIEARASKIDAILSSCTRIPAALARFDDNFEENANWLIECLNTTLVQLDAEKGVLPVPKSVSAIRPTACSQGQSSWAGEPGVVISRDLEPPPSAVSYTHLRAHETPEHLVCRLLLEKKKNKTQINIYRHDKHTIKINYTLS